MDQKGKTQELVQKNPGSVDVGFVVDKVALGQVFSPITSVFLCQFHSTGAPLQGKTKKTLIIFITGLHKQPKGCGASVASAAGPFSEKKSRYEQEDITVLWNQRLQTATISVARKPEQYLTT
jgi:hypothetical protein